MTEEQKQLMFDYIKRNVSHYESRRALSDDISYENRCPMDGRLEDDMRQAAEDWANDYNYENEDSPVDLEEVYEFNMEDVE